MAIICKLINATTWWVLNKDSDIQALAHTIMNEWVIADADTSDFEVTAWQVWSGRALIEVTRTNTTPEEKFMLYVWNQQDEAKTLWSNKKIFIQIPLANINDNTLNTNPTWSWIATIEVEDAYPVSDYYLSLAETDAGWNITDTRTFTSIKGALLDSVASSDIAGWNWKVFYTNWSWVTTELALWAATKVLTSNWATSAPSFESPSLDINSISEKISLDLNDEFVIYDPISGVNKKVKGSTVNWFNLLAWEDITQGNSLCIWDWTALTQDEQLDTTGASTGIAFIQEFNVSQVSIPSSIQLYTYWNGWASLNVDIKIRTDTYNWDIIHSQTVATWWQGSPWLVTLNLTGTPTLTPWTTYYLDVSTPTFNSFIYFSTITYKNFYIGTTLTENKSLIFDIKWKFVIGYAYKAKDTAGFNSFIGFADDTITMWNTIKVNNTIDTNQSWLVIWKYYLWWTSWTIATSWTKFVWVPLSATKILVQY